MINASNGANLRSEVECGDIETAVECHVVRLTGDHQRAPAINQTLPQHWLRRFRERHRFIAC